MTHPRYNNPLWRELYEIAIEYTKSQERAAELADRMFAATRPFVLARIKRYW